MTPDGKTFDPETVTDKQLVQYEQAIDRGLTEADAMRLTEHEYNSFQANAIIAAALNPAVGEDVLDALATPKYTAAQMTAIAKIAIRGGDFARFLDPQMDARRMEAAYLVVAHGGSDLPVERLSRSQLLTINNIPMMNADIVTGVSLCLLFVVFFNGWGAFAGWVNSWQSAIVLPERLTMGFGTLLIAHVCFNIPYVILSVGPKLRQMDKNLVDAAQDLGCTWMQAFWKVILPEIKPGIVSGALTAFTMSIDDFVISYFTAGSSVSTLAMTIYGMTKKRVSPQINAISALLFGTVLLLLVIINVRESRQERKAMQQR